MFADHARLTLVMRGHTDYNQYLDSIINTKPGETVDFSRIEMIIGIYGGPVQAAYDATLSAREKANSIKEAHKEAYRRDRKSTRLNSSHKCALRMTPSSSKQKQ